MCSNTELGMTPLYLEQIYYLLNFKHMKKNPVFISDVICPDLRMPGGLYFSDIVYFSAWCWGTCLEEKSEHSAKHCKPNHLLAMRVSFLPLQHSDLGGHPMGHHCLPCRKIHREILKPEINNNKFNITQDNTCTMFVTGRRIMVSTLILWTKRAGVM